ncbi:MAG TPA: GntR family transcriptional regulator [Ktedonobacteraceae bacterium]|nr:GntR family transcriptional regulator [Ktedonobacteraceae bacterium]
MLPTAYRTKREIATTLLRDAIIRGELAPGKRLLLEELGQKYSLSLTPIREAIPILESEGFVVQLPHKGAVVAQMDREEIRELYAIRSAMESLATLEGVPRLNDKDLADMERLLAALEAFQGSWEAFLDLDRSFHLVPYRAAGSQRWVETIQTLWGRSKRYMLIGVSSDTLADFVREDHRQLLRYCLKRESAQAEAIIRTHLKRTEEHLLMHWSLGPDKRES